MFTLLAKIIISPNSIILLIPPPMYSLPSIIYQDSQICLPCWGASRDRSFSALEVAAPDSARDTNKEKKISLKRYGSAALNRSCCQGKTRDSRNLQAYSKRDRNQSTLPTQEQINQSPEEENYPLGLTFESPAGFRRGKTEQAYFPRQSTLKNKSALTPKAKMLIETTKIQRILPASKDQLEKTKKIGPSTIIDLEKFKASVCSYTEEYEAPPRMEQSQILLDYFHPSERRLLDLQPFLPAQSPRLPHSHSNKF